MESNAFVLNDIFEKKAKVYQSRPVRAMKYEKGMETGFVVRFSNLPNKEEELNRNEGMKFFDTESEAWDYINSNPDQYINVDGELVQVEVIYDKPQPILHRKVDSPDERIGCVNCFEGQYAFISNETEQYDFFYLDDENCEIDVWIIQDADGNIRVWERDFLDCCSTTFLGNPEDFVYEKCVVSGKEEYIKVAV